jgi:hypothetical protein
VRKRDREKREAREGRETKRDRELERFLPSFCYNLSKNSIRLLPREIHRRRREDRKKTKRENLVKLREKMENRERK